MPRLTIDTSVQGSQRSDIFTGEELTGSPSIGLDILEQGRLNTLQGADVISGIGVGNSRFGSTGSDISSRNGIGIQNNGRIETGKQNDTVTGIGTGGAGGIARDAGSTGFGLVNRGTLSVGDGSDRITGAGQAGISRNGGAAGIGIDNIGGKILGGRGNDSCDSLTSSA